MTISYDNNYYLFCMYVYIYVCIYVYVTVYICMCVNMFVIVCVCKCNGVYENWMTMLVLVSQIMVSNYTIIIYTHNNQLLFLCHFCRHVFILWVISFWKKRSLEILLFSQILQLFPWLQKLCNVKRHQRKYWNKKQYQRKERYDIITNVNVHN